MNREAAALSIGKLSKKTGCHIETIRYYEKISLLPAPCRTEGGHRLYSQDLQQRLIFICKARGLGFTLEEVRNLLCLTDSSYSCDEVKQIVLRHIDVVKHKISELVQMQNSLESMAGQCNDGSLPQCAAIDSLFDGAES